MHSWGDKDFDWKALDDAGRDLEKFCRRYGRLGLHVKEKYGTLRAYTHFCSYPILHSLVYPGYVFNQFPKWLWNLDCSYLSPCLEWALPHIQKYQSFIYRKGYEKIVKKYPHIKKEIICCADYPELLGRTIND